VHKDFGVILIETKDIQYLKQGGAIEIAWTASVRLQAINSITKCFVAISISEHPKGISIFDRTYNLRELKNWPIY
jgi:hypothetical protein